MVVRLLVGDPHVGREELTIEELRQLVTGHRGLSAEQRTIISGALEIHERLLREGVVPRPAVWRVHAGLSVDRARQELVGEIYDEADRDIWSVTTLPDGSLLLPGTFPIHDLPAVGVDLDSVPSGNFATIAGLAVAALGRIPTAPGDHVEFAEFTLEITSVGSNVVTGVRLR